MKKILVINFFPAFVPPSSGGELRYFHLYSRLSNQFDVTLLSPTYSHHADETIVHSPTFRERRIPKDPVHDKIHMDIAAEEIASEISALVCSYAARIPNAFHLAYLELQTGVDCIIHESPYMLEYDLLLGRDRRPRIYNSYNVESDLVSQMWKGQHAQKHLSHIIELERRLVKSAKHTFAVSETDAARFSKKFDVPFTQFSIAENGIAIEEFRSPIARSGERISALFFGSFHPPNIEACEFILNDLAPACPKIDFIIAGSCMANNVPSLPINVSVLGRVDNETRLTLFASTDIALNPMFSGGGTNLKSLEYLAAGLPMLATELGTRGLAIEPNRHAIVTDREHFGSVLNALATDSSRRQQLAAEGKRHVAANFSWDAIASSFATTLHPLLTTADAGPLRRSIGVLNDFSVRNAMGGGEVRINRIYSALAKHYNVTLVCLTPAREISTIEVAPNFTEIHIPQHQAHRERNEAYRNQWHISAADIVCYMEAPGNALLCALVRALDQITDLVVLVHPYMGSALPAQPQAPIIYESLNVETDLKRPLLLGHPAYNTLLGAVEQAEREAIQKSCQVVVVSESDLDGMGRLGARADRLHVVPNGVTVPQQQVDHARLAALRVELGGKMVAVFIGSAHPPNIDAANFIRRELAPQFSQCVFLLIGGVCTALDGILPENVKLAGIVDEQAKNILLELADIALNPMLAGSGSNLKLADYFARALPTITSPFGARGYAIQNGQHALICETSEFSPNIRLLLSDPSRRKSLGASGLAFAKAHLDWKLHADRFRAVLERKVFAPTKRKLLIVTFRFSDPPLGGQESHLLELLRGLDVDGRYVIDVATLDIEKIHNEYHFSCRYECNPALQSPADIASLNVFRFPVDHIPPEQRMAGARRLFDAWMDENRANSASHLELLPDSCLLGGWHYPEWNGTRSEVWSSTKALFRANGAHALTISGYSPIKNRITASSAQRQLASIQIDGHFTLTFDCQGVDEIFTVEVENAFIHELDPRKLGVKVHEIKVTTPVGAHELPLGRDNRAILKSQHPERYVEDSIRAALKRSDELESLFQTLRGPNSSRLETWLSVNAHKYDVIMGQGVPFQTICMAAKAAHLCNVPLVQLPHVHIDDDFYHWNSYYAALKAAKVSLAFPRASIPLFYEKLNAASIYLPAGVHEAEAATPDDFEAFRQLYTSTLPYVLVLGRKDLSKNYGQAIAAVKSLNRDGKVCNIIMIGREEDGLPVDARDVLYLGGQPRGVALAAIANALALITMSNSESFGMVIVEAWAQKTPVIVSEKCIASVELVEDGIDGLHATPENLSDKIRHLLDDPALSVRLRENGHKKLLENYTWGAIGNRLADLLEDVISNRAH